jgi:hypothetical protein
VAKGLAQPRWFHTVVRGAVKRVMDHVEASDASQDARKFPAAGKDENLRLEQI